MILVICSPLLLVTVFFRLHFMPDTDLHAVIKKGTLLKDIHQRYVMYQLFKAVKYLHSGNVIHRDQKVHQQMLCITLEMIWDINAFV